MSNASILSPFLIYEQVGRNKQYLLSLLLVCFVSATCFALSAYMGPQVVAFILLLTVSIIALFFTILPVLLATVLSALIWDFFFLLPRYNFRVGNTEDKILLSMYFVIALVNSVLTYKIRQIEKISRQKEEKANTLKLYDTLLNSLSHELRTPIATIIGATDNLLDEPSRLSPNDNKKLLSEIAVASLRLNRQVENLLSMSRLESGFFQPRKDWCDIQDMVFGIIQSLEESLTRHKIEIDIRQDLPLVRIDCGLMEQVIYNLIFNAILYTPEGSLISIRVDCPEMRLMILVEDDGPGFPEQEIDKVFEKFYRMDNSKGSGLGLSIVKGFVEAHNGAIKLTNRRTGGARFVIDLPAEFYFLKLTGS